MAQVIGFLTPMWEASIEFLAPVYENLQINLLFLNCRMADSKMLVLVTFCGFHLSMKNYQDEFHQPWY